MSKLTRQHFEMIAYTVKRARQNLINQGMHMEASGMLLVAHELADQLADSNPHFQRNIFMYACGLEKELK